jgi:cellulose synthase/poly-beta-1,6-N-acetylglucosamine synthase-like glycosyltransferase
MAVLIFWAAIAIVAGVYFGYPAALAFGLLGRRRPVEKSGSEPPVSFIIAAHNEEACIEAKIRNVLAFDYPREKIEILIGSDGSSDRTEEIVRRYESEGVGLISFPQQHGKSAMQNGLAVAASGQILVFTDADCFAARETLRRVIEDFHDARVGLVTARPQYSNERETQISENEGTYVRYESWLRQQESARGLLAMASGSFFALRRSLWRPLDANLGDDFAFPLQVARAGLRNVLEANAVVLTRLAQTQAASMLRLKMRIVSKDLRALIANRALLNPFRYGALAIGLWFHKLLRWLVPYFLMAAFIANVTLLERPIYRVLFALQIAFYGLMAAGFAVRRRTLPSPWSVPTSFCLVNLAALLGTLKCLAGGTSGRWTPERASAPRFSRAREASRDGG